MSQKICQKHGTVYPDNAECPACKSQQEQNPEEKPQEEKKD